MLNANKKFESSLYDKFDNSAKKEGTLFLKQLGYSESKAAPKELYSKGDFYIKTPDKKDVIVECEVKNVWWRIGTWQYPNSPIHIPYRKANSKASIFIMFNKSFNTLLTIDREVLMSSSVVYKNTKNSYTGTETKDEPFIEVPLENVNFYKKANNVWTKI